MSYHHPLQQPPEWSDADDRAYGELGRERPAPSYTISAAMSKDTDVDALSDQEFNARFELLGVRDADFDRRFDEAIATSKNAGSGRLLRADEQDLRRPLHPQSDRVERVEDDRRSKRSGTNADIWGLGRGKV